MQANCSRGLSEDWQAEHVHCVLFVVTFVDPQRFQGICYRAAGWLFMGASRGCAGRTREYFLPHEQPKELFVKAIYPRALQWLRAPHLPEPWAAAKLTRISHHQLEFPIDGSAGL